MRNFRILFNLKDKRIRHLIWLIFFLFIFLSSFILRYFIHDYIPMTLFISSVVVSAWLGGTRIALLATVVGAFIENIFFTPVELRLLNINQLEFIRLSIFMIQGVLISIIFGKFHHLIRKNHQNEIDLADLLKKEKEARDAKNIFLANISHEIRTPLTAISGFAELISTRDLPKEKIVSYAQTILKNAQNLNHIFSDILDLTKIEAGQLRVEFKEVDLQEIIIEVKNTLQLFATNKNIDFVFDEVAPLPISILTDPLRLKQILYNVIGNSIKFTSQGEVKVTVRQDGDKIIFHVSDTGIVIKQEYWHKLFQNFGQANSEIPGNYGGTGLGLALSRKLAQLLNGDVDILTSTPGVGSEFIILMKIIKTDQLKEIFEIKNKSVIKSL